MLQFSRNGKFLIQIMENTIRMFDLVTNKQIYTGSNTDVIDKYTKPHVMNDGKRMFFVEGSKVFSLCTDTNTTKVEKSIEGDTAKVIISLDEKYLYTIYYGRVSIYTLPDLKFVSEFTFSGNYQGVRLTPDGKHIVCREYGPSLQVYNTETCELSSIRLKGSVGPKLFVGNNHIVSTSNARLGYCNLFTGKQVATTKQSMGFGGAILEFDPYDFNIIKFNEASGVLSIISPSGIIEPRWNAGPRGDRSYIEDYAYNRTTYSFAIATEAGMPKIINLENLHEVNMVKE